MCLLVSLCVHLCVCLYVYRCVYISMNISMYNVHCISQFGYLFVWALHLCHRLRISASVLAVIFKHCTLSVAARSASKLYIIECANYAKYYQTILFFFFENITLRSAKGLLPSLHFRCLARCPLPGLLFTSRTEFEALNFRP